jgi:two-component system nitrogen regulation sensor histidine kinase GlnL
MIIDAELWNSLPVPALLLQADETIADSNLAAENFLNLSTKALSGALVWDKVMIDAPLEEAYARARDTQTPLFVNDVDVGSGERPPLQCNVQFAPLSGTDDQMLMLISPREISTRIAQNAQSYRAARSAIGMAEMLAHEIKNPLAGIAGSAQLLSMGLSGEDLELTHLIVEETRRVVSLLEQVEQFGNLQAPRLRPVNIHDVLDRARQSAAVGFGAHMLMIEEYDPSLPNTHTDPDQLQQVFLNLLKNAAQAGGPGGAITLRTFYGGNHRRRPRPAARHRRRGLRALRVGPRERNRAGPGAGQQADRGHGWLDFGGQRTGPHRLSRGPAHRAPRHRCQ